MQVQCNAQCNNKPLCFKARMVVVSVVHIANMHNGQKPSIHKHANVINLLSVVDSNLKKEKRRKGGDSAWILVNCSTLPPAHYI